MKHSISLSISLLLVLRTASLGGMNNKVDQLQQFTSCQSQQLMLTEINDPDLEPYDTLLQAIIGNYPEVMRSIIKAHSIDPNFFRECLFLPGTSSSMYISSSWFDQIAEVGTDIHLLTPLAFAIFTHRPEPVMTLLELGADPELSLPQAPSPINALSIAICNGNLEIVQLLVDHGVTITETILSHASKALIDAHQTSDAEIIARYSCIFMYISNRFIQSQVTKPL